MKRRENQGAEEKQEQRREGLHGLGKEKQNLGEGKQDLLGYILHFYWIFILLGVFFVALGIHFFLASRAQERIILYVSLYDCASSLSEEELEEDFLGWLDREEEVQQEGKEEQAQTGMEAKSQDGTRKQDEIEGQDGTKKQDETEKQDETGRTISFYITGLLQESPGGSYGMASLSRFYADVGTGKVDVAGFMEEEYASFARTDCFLDLKELWGEDWVEENLQDLYFYEGKPVGLYVRALPGLARLGLYQDQEEAVLGLLKDSERIPMATAYLRYLQTEEGEKKNETR